MEVLYQLSYSPVRDDDINAASAVGQRWAAEPQSTTSTSRYKRSIS